MSTLNFPLEFLHRAGKAAGKKQDVPSSHSSLRHNLANHVSLPDLDDVQEPLVYLTLLFIVLSWMLREIHIAFFTTGLPFNVDRHNPLICCSREWYSK